MIKAVLVVVAMAAVPVVDTLETEECLPMKYEAGLHCKLPPDSKPYVNLNGYTIYEVSDGFIVYKDGVFFSGSVGKNKLQVL